MLRFIPIEDVKSFPLGAEVLIWTHLPLENGDHMVWGTIRDKEEFGVSFRMGLYSVDNDLVYFDRILFLSWDRYGKDGWALQLRTK